MDIITSFLAGVCVGLFLAVLAAAALIGEIADVADDVEI